MTVAARAACAPEAGQHLLPYSGMLIAMKRNLGHASAAASAALCDYESSRQTVTRWELKLGTAIVSGMINVHADGETSIQQATGWRMSTHLFKGDATKSAAWKHQKVQSLYVRSSYILNLDDRADGPVICSRSVWTDTQVADDCSGTGMAKLIHKQLRSCGCPALDADDLAMDHVLRIVVTAGDDGPDQKVFRRLLLEKYRHSPQEPPYGVS